MPTQTRPALDAANAARQMFIARAASAPLDHLLLDVADRLGGVQPLGAGIGAVHDGVAAIELERVFELVEPLAGLFVAAVLEPSRRLEQHKMHSHSPSSFARSASDWRRSRSGAGVSVWSQGWIDWYCA